MQRKLTTIKEDDVLIDSTNELEQLQSEMLVVSNQIAQDFYKLKSYAFSANHILECNFNASFMNTNFDEQELIEEQMDRFVFQYVKLKEHFKKGREIRCFKEKKEKKEQEKSNELRYARNVLAQLGLDKVDE
jgi:hypothetical protein